jgi:hypothetical protein
MAPSLTQQQKLVHFLNRTSFGPTREELEKLQQSGITAYLDQQLSPDQIPDSVVADRVAELKTMRLSSRELLELYPQAAVASQRHGHDADAGAAAGDSGAAACQIDPCGLQPAPALRSDGRLLEQSFQYIRWQGRRSLALYLL